jgi:predicted Rossmann-fold nucleotide-binding protein
MTQNQERAGTNVNSADAVTTPIGEKLAIVGSRNYPLLDKVVEFVNHLPWTTTVISGGARGVDQTAQQAALERGLKVVEIRPNWKKYGKAAGFRRNTEIVLASDIVVCFWDGESRGTWDSFVKARKYLRPVVVFNEHGEPEHWLLAEDQVVDEAFYKDKFESDRRRGKSV